MKTQDNRWDRLNEPSTWAALAALIGIAAPEMAGAIPHVEAAVGGVFTAVAGFCAAVGIIKRERSN